MTANEVHAHGDESSSCSRLKWRSSTWLWARFRHMRMNEHLANDSKWDSCTWGWKRFMLQGNKWCSSTWLWARFRHMRMNEDREGQIVDIHRQYGTIYESWIREDIINMMCRKSRAVGTHTCQTIVWFRATTHHFQSLESILRSSISNLTAMHFIQRKWI
jgi:hypothetical protein